jgi:gas vesicle protein
MSTGKILTGVAAGIAAGAIIGILLAPDKGSETRRKIAQKGNDLKDSIKARFSSMVDDVVDEYENTKDAAEGAVQRGKEKMQNMKADARQALS